jgi:zinc protease
MKIDRTRLPTPGDPRPFIFPPIEKSTLENGLGVWTVRHTAVPVVTLLLLTRRGAADDPDDKEGLAALTVDMLDEGSDGRSAIEMHEALARIGAAARLRHRLRRGAAWHHDPQPVCRPTRCPCSRMVVRPSLTEAISRVCGSSGCTGSPSSAICRAPVADRTFARLLFGTTRMATRRSAPSAARTRCRWTTFRHSTRIVLRPSEATLVAVGDCHARENRAVRPRRVSDWSGEARSAHAAAAPTPQPPRLARRAQRAASQSELASAMWRWLGIRPTTTRSWRRTWCSAASSSAAST